MAGKNLRKSISIVLSLALLFLVGCANKQMEELERTPSNAAPEEASLENYLPLQYMFEDNGYKVLTDEVSGTISLTSDDDVFVLYANTNEIERNGNRTKLQYPLVHDENKYSIHFDDCAYLFTTKEDIYYNTQKKMIPYIYNEMQNNQMVGLTIAFVDENSGYTYTRGFGYEDLEAAVKVTEKSVFPIASISKNFTALAVMQLAEQGKIDLDEEVVSYLPDFHLKTNPLNGGEYENITVRMLLNHTSGINTDMLENVLTTGNNDPAYMNNFLKNTKNMYMMNKEGERAIYSNAGYTMLGLIIASVSDPAEDDYSAYHQYMAEQIFRPLGMEQTTFDKQNVEHVKNYYSSERPEEFQSLNSLPAGGLFSSSSDMVHYLRMHLNNGSYNGRVIISENSMSQMRTPPQYADPFSPEFKYGFGTIVRNNNMSAYYGHTGDTWLSHSAFYINPEANMAAFAAVNSDSGGYITTRVVLNMIEVAIAEKGMELQDTTLTQDIATAFEYKALKEYEGYYIGVGRVDIDENDNAIFVDNGETLPKNANGTYSSENLGLLQFATIDGRDCIIQVENVSRPIYQKATVTPIDDSNRNYIGTYRAVPYNENDVPFVKNVIIATDPSGNLIIALDESMSLYTYLTAIGDNQYVVSGVGRSFGYVIEFVPKEDSVQFSYAGILFSK